MNQLWATSLTLDTFDGQEVAEGSVPFRLPVSDFCPTLERLPQLCTRLVDEFLTLYGMLQIKLHFFVTYIFFFEAMNLTVYTQSNPIYCAW